MSIWVSFASASVIALPEGADTSTMEGLIAAMPLMEPRHFIMPFLAHALGTLVGAFIAAKIAVSRRMACALIVGVFFLIGGTANVFLLPAPMWFNITDLALAYIPMAYLGGRMAGTGKM